MCPVPRNQGIETVQTTRLVSASPAGRTNPSVQAACCEMTRLAAALRMRLPRALSDARTLAASVTLRLLLKMDTVCAPGVRSAPLAGACPRKASEMTRRTGGCREESLLHYVQCKLAVDSAP